MRSVPVRSDVLSLNPRPSSGKKLELANLSRLLLLLVLSSKIDHSTRRFHGLSVYHCVVSVSQSAIMPIVATQTGKPFAPSVGATIPGTAAESYRLL